MKIVCVLRRLCVREERCVRKSVYEEECGYICGSVHMTGCGGVCVWKTVCVCVWKNVYT